MKMWLNILADYTNGDTFSSLSANLFNNQLPKEGVGVLAITSSVTNGSKNFHLCLDKGRNMKSKK